MMGDLKFYFHGIDAMNNQGGLEMHKHTLARWQIYKAMYPEYVSDKPPVIVARVWTDPNLAKMDP